MKTSSIVAIVVAILIIGGLVWYMSANPTTNTQVSQTASSTDTGASTTVASSTATTTPQTMIVHYNGTSFSPQTVTIHKGESVTWIADSGKMWVASAPHPTHTGYDGTTEQVHCAQGYTGPAPFDQCSSGSSFSFTFDKTGSWKFHNHFNTSAFGMVIVQ